VTDLADLTLRQFADGRTRGDFSAEEVTRAALGRIARVEPTVHAYLRVDAEAALAAAPIGSAGRRARSGGRRSR
jgi:aspartyl-tRNA(Asn)/glutamyl-tRNA(Gln) amidotransferase subunit A